MLKDIDPFSFFFSQLLMFCSLSPLPGWDFLTQIKHLTMVPAGIVEQLQIIMCFC